MSHLHRPQSLEEALAHLAAGGPALAGGTDLFPALVDRPPPTSLVDLSNVAGLRAIDIAPDHIRIGAAARWSEIARAQLPPALFMLQQAAREIGARQIQNRGTLGGNLCNASPAADGAPPLLALDASVELAGPAGRRVLPLRDFLQGNRQTTLQPHELMVAILAPRTHERAGSAFLKLGARRYLVISIIMVAALIEADSARRIKNARIAIGAASAVARRLGALEERLIGASLDEDFATRIVADDFAELTPIDDVRASAAYRRAVAPACIARALAQAAGRA